MKKDKLSFYLFAVVLFFGTPLISYFIADIFYLNVSLVYACNTIGILFLAWIKLNSKTL